MYLAEAALYARSALNQQEFSGIPRQFRQEGLLRNFGSHLAVGERGSRLGISARPGKNRAHKINRIGLRESA